MRRPRSQASVRYRAADRRCRRERRFAGRGSVVGPDRQPELRPDELLRDAHRGRCPARSRVHGELATSFVVPSLSNGSVYTFTVTAQRSNLGPESVPPTRSHSGFPTRQPRSCGTGERSSRGRLDRGAAGQSHHHRLRGDAVHRCGRAVTQTFPDAGKQTITGLANGTAYTFKVAAIDSFTTGPQSAASSGITVGAPVAPPRRRSRTTALWPFRGRRPRVTTARR